MTVVELLQCVMWGVFVIAPLRMAYIGGADKDGDDTELIILAALLQVTAMVFAYKAGGK